MGAYLIEGPPQGINRTVISQNVDLDCYFEGFIYFDFKTLLFHLIHYIYFVIKSL